MLDLFHIKHWPDGIGAVDLGDRVIDVIPILGHSDTSIALYDRKTAILFTGDSLYPGTALRPQLRRIPGQAPNGSSTLRKAKPVAHILGNHIEQTRTSYLDYAEGSMYQPNEHVLELSRGSLLELDAALLSLHGHPARLALSDFTIWPSPANDSERAAEEKRFLETQKQQLNHMWDQVVSK